ncbi:MAG TPA: hypothetical protein H9749_03605 [Candidatus Acutalibacter stercorigallinarum]|nr:hypothetical protein [Candidatus Acutalibacter stercorigallinarum]
MNGFFQSLGEFLLATGPAVHGVTWAALAVVLAAAVGLPLWQKLRRREHR